MPSANGAPTSAPGPLTRNVGAVDFDEVVRDALDTLPSELGEFMSNIDVVVEEEPPAGMPLLGLYQGIPLTRRGAYYGGALPDKITIFRGPLERLYGDDPDRLRREIRRVVLHEVAHHFGISDERLIELDRY
jgi:predicted Zn-dependent protease with MMP-like domain